MRSARGPSSSRRQTGIEPRARTSLTSPSVRSLATTLPAAPPVSFGEGSRARSSRCEAADRSNNWVSVNFTGSSIRLATTIAAVTTEAPQGRPSRQGRIQPQGQAASSRRATLPLCCNRKASPFWIILLLVSGRPDHRIILMPQSNQPIRRLAGRRGPHVQRRCCAVRASCRGSIRGPRSRTARPSNPIEPATAAVSMPAAASSTPAEKPDADAKCFGDQIQPACRHAVGAVFVFLHLLEGDGTDLPGEIALTEAELYAAQFDASAYVDVEPCRKGFVIVLSFRHFRCSLDANKRKGPARMRRPGKTSHRCAVLNRPRPTSSPSRHVRCAGLCGPQDRGRALAPVDPRARRFSPVPRADRRDL